MRGGGVREALLVEGPAGWGECSPLPGYPCAYERARAAADEAAFDGWPSPVRADVAVNALVASVGDAEAAVAAGYACLKVKVARDVELVAAVRDAVGPGIAIRVDANGAWDVDTAVAAIRRLAAYDVEFVEQPVASLDDLAAVRRQVDTPIAADECVRTVEDARALEIAEAAGVAPVVTSMMETSVGLAAGLALAAAVPDLPYACGLGTANVFVEDIVAEPLTPARGRLAVRRPVPDPGLLDRYRVAAA
jgi:O-succinylbenzoate synthase